VYSRRMVSLMDGFMRRRIHWAATGEGEGALSFFAKKAWTPRHDSCGMLLFRSHAWEGHACYYMFHLQKQHAVITQSVSSRQFRAEFHPLLKQQYSWVSSMEQVQI
jgi:hypothetical protein